MHVANFLHPMLLLFISLTSESMHAQNAIKSLVAEKNKEYLE